MSTMHPIQSMSIIRHHGVETFLEMSGYETTAEEAKKESIIGIAHAMCSHAAGRLENKCDSDFEKITVKIGSIYGQMMVNLLELVRIGWSWFWFGLVW